MQKVIIYVTRRRIRFRRCAAHATHMWKGEDGERTLEELVRLAAKPIAYIGCTVIFLGLIYLGINLRDGARAGGGELRKAIAMIAAGAAVTGFAAIYGFTGF